MTESDILLNATVSLLLIGLLSHRPGLRRRLGRGGLALLAAGCLIPLGGALFAYLVSEDRIEFLSRLPLFFAPVQGLLLIVFVSGVAAFAVGGRNAGRIGLALGAGYLLTLALLALTPAGVPLLEPLSPQRFALAILPAGHPPLLVLLIAGLIALEAPPRGRGWVWWATTGLALLYLGFGAASAVAVRIQAGRSLPAGGALQVLPTGGWLTGWVAVRVGAEAYELERYGAGGQRLAPSVRLRRWNDQATLVKLLNDPVVRRFYFQVFHHPVAEIETSGAQMTLLLRELEDTNPPVPGRTFYLESDLRGGNRFYQLQRFD
jgi:hypothetical protein